MRDLNVNVLSSLATQFDSDAAAFITAANISSTTQIIGINNLTKDLKRNNLWNKMLAIYPVVGGTENSHKYNLKDPRDVNAAYRLSFTAGWTHSANGMTPNGSATADTFLAPSTIGTSHHISFYSRTQNSQNGVEMGSGGPGGAGINQVSISFYYPSLNNKNFTSGGYPTFAAIAVGSTRTTGFTVGSRISSTDARLFYNGAQLATNTNSTTAFTTVTTKIGANDAVEYSTKQCAFASIGLGLTASEVSTFNTIVEAYQTTLGRQVVQATTIPRIESTIPTRLFGPRELFGSSLITHFDTTDYKNYSLTTLTHIPIPQTGLTIVGAMFDISPQRRRYNFSTTLGNITEANDTWIVLSGTSGGTPLNQFSGSSFDTNKGTLGVGSVFTSTLVELYTPYSGSNNIAPNSGVTLGFYTFLNQNLINHFGIGPNRNCAGNSYPNFGFSYTSTTGANNVAAFFGRTGTTNNNIRISNNRDLTPYLYSYRMFLFTITAYTYYWYIDNVLFDSGTIGVGASSPDSFYPFTGVTGNGNYLSIEGRLQANTNTAEGFLASEYTPPEQVNLLYNYFITKFKNKKGNINSRYI